MHYELNPARGMLIGLAVSLPIDLGLILTAIWIVRGCK